MGLRFRKSIKIAPGIKLNLSKSGIGVSAGVRGVHIGANSRGTYSSVGIPGTGISSMSYQSSGGGKSSSKTSVAVSLKPGMFASTSSRAVQTKTGSGLFWIGLLDFVLLAAQWPVGIVAIALTFAWHQYYLKNQPSFQAKKHLRDAQTAYKAGEYQKAAEEFEVAYAFFSNDKAIALLAASSYSQLKQYDKSVRFSEEYLAIHPEDIEMQKMLARWCNETGEKDKALGILQSLDVEQTKDSNSLLLMAEILSDKGLDDAAIEVLKRAPLAKHVLTPDLVEVIYALGVLYEKTGDKKHARSSFERVYAYDASFKDVAERVK